MPRVLLTDDDTKPACGLGAFQISRAIDSQEFAAVRRDEFIPPRDIAQRTCMDIALREADCGMEDGYSRSAQLLKIGRGKTRRLRLPRRQLGVVEGQQPEHVDDSRTLHQVQN